MLERTRQSQDEKDMTDIGTAKLLRGRSTGIQFGKDVSKPLLVEVVPVSLEKCKKQINKIFRNLAGRKLVEYIADRICILLLSKAADM
jgi:hypothetical protein